MPQSNAPFALAATCMVLVGCYEPPLLSRGDQALAAGKYSEALSIYRAAESDDALDRASLAKRQTEAALGFLDDKLEPIKAKPAEEALAELKGILDQREFATPALADRIRQAMTEVVEKAWPAIEADLKPGRFPHAIERAAKLMAGVPQDHPTRQRFLDARAAAASYLVTRASQLGKEHVILRRALLGLASAYGAPGGLGEIDRELEKRFGYSVQVTLASTACEAASHALQSELQRAGAPGGAGVVTVALSVSTCNPERKESTEEKTVTWEEWKRVTVMERDGAWST